MGEASTPTLSDFHGKTVREIKKDWNVVIIEFTDGSSLVIEDEWANHEIHVYVEREEPVMQMVKKRITL